MFLQSNANRLRGRSSIHKDTWNHIELHETSYYDVHLSPQNAPPQAPSPCAPEAFQNILEQLISHVETSFNMHDDVFIWGLPNQTTDVHKWLHKDFRLQNIKFSHRFVHQGFPFSPFSSFLSFSSSFLFSSWIIGPPSKWEPETHVGNRPIHRSHCFPFCCTPLSGPICTVQNYHIETDHKEFHKELLTSH